MYIVLHPPGMLKDESYLGCLASAWMVLRHLQNSIGREVGLVEHAHEEVCICVKITKSLQNKTAY